MNLSKPQELIWDMERFAGGSVAVICASTLRAGQQDEASLQAAANELFRRNDALRIRLRVSGSEAEQYIADHVPRHMEALRFSDSAALTAYANHYARIPFCLAGSLCEMKLLILPDRYGLLVKAHHLVADGWTMALLAAQFHTLLEGRTPQSHSYQSFCEKDAAYPRSSRYFSDRQFFLELAARCHDPVFLRAGRAASYISQRETLVLSPADMAAIHGFCREHACSVCALFATVLAIYMSRINGNPERFFIGTTVLNRTNAREMHTAGMFVNTVPMLMNVAAEKSFQENLTRSEDMLMSLFRHQRYHYGQLRREAGRRGPLFDVILNYMHPVPGQWESIWHPNGMQNESLQIHMEDGGSRGMQIHYDHQMEKFSRSDILTLHSHLRNLLFGGIHQPASALCKLKMLSKAEEQSLLVEMNQTDMAYPVPAGSTLFSLFEANARKNRDKVCITAHDGRLRYGQLLQASEAIDSVIRAHTRGRKSVVAVIAQRSPDMYCAIYGIIRGGNAYLPITPDTPRQRIRYMLRSSGAALVAAQAEFVDLAEDTPCINISQLLQNPQPSTAVPPCAAVENDTAYVIYTSGSTGHPKGVRISHSAAVNRILWMARAYPLGDDGVILQKTPYTFDVSVWEIFWWGICGGSLAVSRPGEHFLPGKILDEVADHQVTHLHFVPSVLDLFITYLENRREERCRFCSVRHVFASGEVLEPGLVQRFYALFDHEQVKLHNLYGPTECAVDVTCYDCRPTDTVIPIGQPIANTRIYITDKFGSLLPVGAVGELLIGGRNVGQGYVNDPALTEARFVPNPFGDGRLYRTGDLACRRADGQIIFHGRMDDQVKLHGQRVEPGEIEAVIKGVPGVDAAAVTVTKEPECPALAAFYCAAGDLDESILRACREMLPVYMVPTYLSRIDEIPLHPNGKLNRRVLTAHTIQPQSADAVTPPADALEKRICEAFQNVLAQVKIGRDSDFFGLGGTSLSMISLLSENDWLRITPAQFIGSPTPAKLAAILRTTAPQPVKYLEPLHQAAGGTKAYVLFPFAGGGAEGYASLANAMVQQDPTVSLYFVRFLHSEGECEAAAAEIAAVLDGKEVWFYSHCAGSAVALGVIHALEKRRRDFVKHYVAAASLPFPSAGGKNIWNHVPDSLLKLILTKAGAPKQMLGHPQLRSRFRADTDFAALFFSKQHGSIHCPMSIIVGQRDLFTRFCRCPEKQWALAGLPVRKVHRIPASTHYFHSAHSRMLAELLLSDGCFQ